MELGLFWILFQFVIYLTVVAAWGGEKTMIKVDDIEQLIRRHARDCYPPKVDKEQFLALMIVALTTGRVANRPETKCFLFCVMRNYRLMIAPEGKVNIPVLNTTIANMTHPLLKEIIMNNMELCTAACDTTDPCINALKYARCFAKQGLFVYVKLEEPHFPTARPPKNGSVARHKIRHSSGNKWIRLNPFKKMTTVPMNGTLTTVPMNATTAATAVTTTATAVTTTATAVTTTAVVAPTTTAPSG